jgi:cytochrome d ubiquinol oxidase subunit I
MVGLGLYFIIFFFLIYVAIYRKKIENMHWLLWLAVWTIPLPYIASEAGWILAEVGRQPWVVQDYLPAVAAISHVEASAVQTTFWMFAVLFTVLLIAEIKIMLKQIKTGSNEGGN